MPDERSTGLRSQQQQTKATYKGTAVNAFELSSDQLISALHLPAEATVGQRVPKKMLAENLASRVTATSADRKLLQEHVDEITWVAAVKPSNAGIPTFEDEQRAYLELAVICARLRQGEQANAHPAKTNPKVSRIAELVHRAIPYPVLLILDDGAYLHVSMVHIRWAQKETEKTVLDEELIQGVFQRSRATDASGATEALNAFLSALDLSKQPRSDLFRLYQGWMDTLSAWQASAVTGRFQCVTPEQAIERRAALRRCQELDAQISSLRTSASKEKQMVRQVQANLEIKALMAERQKTIKTL